MNLLDKLRELKRKGWKRFPDNKKPNTKKNLKKYDFCSCGLSLFYKLKI